MAHEIDTKFTAAATLMFTIAMLTSNYFFVRNPEIVPEQLIFAISIVTLIFTIIEAVLNKNLSSGIWKDIPTWRAMLMIILRCAQGSSIVVIHYSILKYMNMVYIGIVHNVVVLLLRAIKINPNWITILLCLGGTATVIFGYSKQDELAPWEGKFGIFTLPLFMVIGNILIARM